MLNRKNQQKNLCRTGGAANSKIVGPSSWTICQLLQSCCLRDRALSLRILEDTFWSRWPWMTWSWQCSWPWMTWSWQCSCPCQLCLLASWAIRSFSCDHIVHEDLYWLDVADRVTYKLGVIMHRCQHGKAPRYLVDCCTPATNVFGRRHLQSATQQLMVVSRHRLSTIGRRVFAVHGPMVWNSARRPPYTAGLWFLQT